MRNDDDSMYVRRDTCPRARLHIETAIDVSPAYAVCPIFRGRAPVWRAEEASDTVSQLQLPKIPHSRFLAKYSLELEGPLLKFT